ncbi:TRAP transporter substrate-binding protein [Sagittula stellata]|uniref:TRAP dicarboxylate transporter DctP subunit n=1 Tax=Sagittula stellata (strain ATCC 700073 / DSM 11524 / E-37) TaxID=388399 RepID=A3KBD0_SAGS3|nr:TRAP transporter substrate-binding protein [Sagittula stellata]EBA05520.1 TRAP dicarboxylate transporter DctP subunit [Sagittula stellata E-37]
MKRTSVALAAILAVVGPLSAQAQEVTLRLSHWIPPTIAPATKGIDPWVASLEEASEGRIAVQVFPAQQLGKAPDHYDMAAQGIVDLAWVNPGYTAGRFPIYSATELPFMSDDNINGTKAIHEWYLANGAETEMSDVKLCFVHSHAPGAFHSKVPVTRPEQVKGMNVRPAHATIARFISLLGGGPVQVPAPEVREALSKGTAEAVTFPWGAMYDFKLTEEVPVHLDMPFYLSAQVLVMNKNSYEGLSDENKAVIDSHCTPEWSGKVSAGWAEDDMAAKDKLKADDTQSFNTPTEEDVVAWREAAQPLIEEWKEAVSAKGGDADAILEAYKAALKKYDADY